MASRGAGLAQGLESGFRLGALRDQIGLARERGEREQVRDERDAEKFGREKQGWADEDLLKDFESSLFEADPAPDGASPDGLGEVRRQDNLGTLNQAVQRGFKLLQDPKYATVRGKAIDSITALGKKSQEMNDVLQHEAKTRVLPHMRTLYSPGTTDEAKSAALTEMMSDLYPDGRVYQAKVAGVQVTVLDDKGAEISKMTLDDVDKLVRDGLATPENFYQLREAAINARVAEAKETEERAYTEAREDFTHARDRSESLADEDREVQRKRRDAIGSYVNDELARYDRAAAKGEIIDDGKLVEVMGANGRKERVSKREAFKRNLVAQAREAWTDGGARPAAAKPPPELGLIEVDVSDPAAAGPGRPAANAPRQKPVIPKPSGARSPTSALGLDDPELAQRFEVVGEGQGVQRIKEAVGDARDAVVGAGLDALTPHEKDAANIQRINSALAKGGPVGKDTSLLIRYMTGRSDDYLISLGLSPQGVQNLRAMAKAAD